MYLSLHKSSCEQFFRHSTIAIVSSVIVTPLKFLSPVYFSLHFSYWQLPYSLFLTPLLHSQWCICKPCSHELYDSLTPLRHKFMGFMWQSYSQEPKKLDPDHTPLLHSQWCICKPCSHELYDSLTPLRHRFMGFMWQSYSQEPKKLDPDQD